MSLLVLHIVFQNIRVFSTDFTKNDDGFFTPFRGIIVKIPYKKILLKHPVIFHNML